MRIFVEVVLQGTDDLRNDVNNWDIYGAAEALDTEMTKFKADNFFMPTGMSAAQSLTNPNFSWSVIYSTSSAKPTINFYNYDTSALIGKIEGTPVVKGDVYALLNRLVSINLNNNAGGATTTPTTPTTITANTLGYGLVGLLVFLLIRLKK